MDEVVDDEEAAMRAMMGFGGFDTTKVGLLSLISTSSLWSQAGFR